MKRGREWLLEHFLPDVDGYDVVIGYRADDSYFSFARAFVNNEISLEQLSYAMRLGKLGEQYVLKSQKASAIHFSSYEGVDSVEYYVKRRARVSKLEMPTGKRWKRWYRRYLYAGFDSRGGVG